MVLRCPIRSDQLVEVPTLHRLEELGPVGGGEMQDVIVWVADVAQVYAPWLAAMCTVAS